MSCALLAKEKGGADFKAKQIEVVRHGNLVLPYLDVHPMASGLGGSVKLFFSWFK